ncbi:unnamed protein product [Allacma fusca]|uniref:Tetraspanin n=1 Tax=Allacma fusca TaxID=39272 RepID=A0A8J2PWM0_9HEXA|nr:unnamed protein product [Allacma fusca]
MLKSVVDYKGLDILGGLLSLTTQRLSTAYIGPVNSRGRKSERDNEFTPSHNHFNVVGNKFFQDILKMGKGRGLTDNCIVFTLILVNVLCGILGALIFALSIWMRLENEVRDWVQELGMYQYWNGLYILMAAGIIIVLISFCGCCGTIAGSPALLGTSAVLILLAVILELAGGIYILVNGTEASKLTPYLEKTFNKLILDSNYNPRVNLALQAIQEKVGCCGSVNYQDYDRARLPISDYCRDALTGNVYQDGCVKKFSNFIEQRTGWIAGIALFIVALQIILVVLTFMRCREAQSDDGDLGRKKQRYDTVPVRGN